MLKTGATIQPHDSVTPLSAASLEVKGRNLFHRGVHGKEVSYDESSFRVP